MKTRGSILVSLLVLCAGLLAFINPAPPEEIAIGTKVPMPSYRMKDITGKQVSLNDIKKEKGLLVIFSCNTCPYVKLSESRIKEYTDYCLDNGIGSALINSNEAQRTEDDSFEAMVKYYNDQKLRCCYAVDEKSQLANAFGAGRTPQCFLFDGRGELIYKGAIDDNVKDPSAVKSAYLKDAISALLRNETPRTQQTKSIGCTIKRAES
jgi:hypothetical protein